MHTCLGFGKPSKAIPQVVNDNKFDLLVMGTHGHKDVMDLILGTTVNRVRHRIQTPLFIVNVQKEKK